MSFRGRLTLFFVLIVVVPMVSVTGILFSLIADNEKGQADARTAARLDSAINLYYGARRIGDRVAVRIGRDVALARAVQAGDAAAARRRAAQLMRGGAQRIVIAGRGRPLVDLGRADAVFPATRELLDTERHRFGTLQVSTENARGYARRVQRITGLQVILHSGEAIIASTLPDVAGLELPEDPATVKVGDEDYRAASFTAPGFLGRSLAVTVLDPMQSTKADVGDARLIAAAILAGFVLLAVLFALRVSRSLQSEIARLLGAARRLGSGDFSAEVPVTGRDEFAALAEEFNKMSRQLAARVVELQEERGRLQRSLRRIGETFASNLDRDALLEIVVQTAIEGVAADGGRASARSEDGGPLKHIALAGPIEELEEAMEAAEARVLETGRPHEGAIKGIHAMAHPLREAPGSGRVHGVVTVARAGGPFTDGERELFHYLAGQASVSIENVALHETVERQAATDELTGLFNRRRFDEVLDTEVERARRFGQELGLVMLDLDDFKLVNDTYGHQQGDVVLREVARILRESAREIDEPARIGGEELALVLPGTDLDGAFKLAERVRTGIEALEIPQLAARGERLRVTASIGVATLPGSADSAPGLVAAADEALYRAKRAGKNRAVRAAASVKPH